MSVVELTSVSKSFGGQPAVRDLSLRIEAGKRVGLLGPNGSGKTTTLRMLLGLFPPDAGKITVLGRPPSHETSERVGYLPEERGLYRDMKVVDLLRYYARLKGRQSTAKEISGWLERLGVTQYADQRIRALSKGTAQKIQFISTVLHEPELLILDEPFSGLDPVSRQLLSAAIDHLTQLRTTLIFSTHDMSAAETLCDHYLMLHRGRKVLDASRGELRERTRERVVKVTTGDPLSHTDIPGVQRRRGSGTELELVLESDADPQRILEHLVARTSIVRFEVTHPSLEEVFLRLAQT